MNYQIRHRQILFYLFWALLWGNATPSYAVNFSLDPASDSIDGNITPDDVLNSDSTIATSGSELGLEDDFFVGFFDNLNAISYGKDSLKGPFYFSVDKLSLGLAGTAVQSQRLADESAGDVYLNSAGSNQLFLDEEELGLIPGFLGDDLDALAIEDKPNGGLTYFSLDDLSFTNFFDTYSSDILLSDGNDNFSIFADGFSDIGLQDTDNIDALALLDVFEPGVLNPGIDKALFSLSSFSDSLFTTGFSSADILFTDFTGDFSQYVSASELGLDAFDELDALDTVNVPEPLTILGTTTAIAFGALFKRKQK